MYYNIGELLGFFDLDAFVLRQSLVKIISNIILYVLNGDNDNLDENQKKTYYQMKQKFLQLLMERFHDKSSFCRKKVITVFIKLTEENVVSRDLYMVLFKHVIGRFRDQTMLVRRYALRLYRQLMEIFGLIFNIDVKTGEKFLKMG